MGIHFNWLILNQLDAEKYQFSYYFYSLYIEYLLTLYGTIFYQAVGPYLQQQRKYLLTYVHTYIYIYLCIFYMYLLGVCGTGNIHTKEILHQKYGGLQTIQARGKKDSRNVKSYKGRVKYDLYLFINNGATHREKYFSHFCIRHVSYNLSLLLVDKNYLQDKLLSSLYWAICQKIYLCRQYKRRMLNTAQSYLARNGSD